jgi:heat shock protein HspQ
MMHTLQTTRVNTNYIPPPRQAPFYLVVVEEVPVELHHHCVENGVIIEDSSEEILVTPTLLSESDAFAT